MYGFSEDEQHLLFMDCFGLTRLSRAKAVKTDAKISGSESAGLVSVAADGSAAATYEDLWDKSVLWAFPELKSAVRFDRFRERGVVVHPDGRHYLVLEAGQLAIKPLSKTVLLPLRLDAPKPSKQAARKEVRVPLAGGEELPDLKLGDGRPNVGAPLRVAHDGTLVHWDGQQLIGAALDGMAVTVKWRRRLSVPDGARVDIYADARRCVVLLHRGRRWTVVERVAGKDHTRELDSLAVPTVAGRFLLHQPSADRVVRIDLDNGESQELSLEIASKQGLSHTGPGTIFAGAQGSALFLPQHRESILDLVAEVEIPRKLPAKEFEIRQALLAIARPYVDAARLAGVCIELGRVELNPKYNSVSVTHRIAGGASLFGALLGGYAQSAWSGVSLPGGWRMGSYGSHGGIGRGERLTVEELVEAYATLAECGLHFASTIGFWGSELERGDQTEPAVLGLLAQALLALMRDGVAAKLDFAKLARLGRPSVDEVLKAFEKYPERASELDHSVTRMTGQLCNRLYGADAARIYRAVYLEAKWDHLGSAYGDFDYYAITPLLREHPDAGEVFREWLRKHPRVDEQRQWYVDQLRTRLGG
jgi:hypothetical protein